jgi:hypothetical protein
MPGQEKIIDSEQQFKQPFVKFSQIVFFLLLAAAHNVAVLPAILLAVRILGMGGKNLRDKLLFLADQLRLLAESILDAQPVRTARPATRRKKTADCIRCSRHLPLRARGACDACYQRISLDISQGKYTDEQAVAFGVLLPKDKPGRRSDERATELARQIALQDVAIAAEAARQKAVAQSSSPASPMPDEPSPARTPEQRTPRP